MRTRKPKATVLYDYNPAKDSPYSDQEDEISLKQGQIISIIHPERADGFCKVKVKYFGFIFNFLNSFLINRVKETKVGYQLRF